MARESNFSASAGVAKVKAAALLLALGALGGEVAQSRVPFPPHHRDVCVLGTRSTMEHPGPDPWASRTCGWLLWVWGTQTLHPTEDAANVGGAASVLQLCQLHFLKNSFLECSYFK